MNVSESKDFDVVIRYFLGIEPYCGPVRSEDVRAAAMRLADRAHPALSGGLDGHRVDEAWPTRRPARYWVHDRLRDDAGPPPTEQPRELAAIARILARRGCAARYSIRFGPTYALAQDWGQIECTDDGRWEVRGHDGYRQNGLHGGAT